MNQRNSDLFQIIIGVPENNWYDGSVPGIHKDIEEKVQEYFGEDMKVEKSIIGRGASGLGLEIDFITALAALNSIPTLFLIFEKIQRFRIWLKNRSKEENHGQAIMNIGLIKLLCIGHALSIENVSSVLEIISLEELAGGGPNYEGYDYYSCLILKDRESDVPKIINIVINAYGDILGSSTIEIDKFNAIFSRHPIFKIVK